MKKIKQELELKRKSLESRVKDLDNEISKKDNPLSMNEEEQVSQISDDDVLERLRSEYKKEILSIDQAIQRIDNSEYGECMDCGEKINSKRLKARPYTTCCLECQNDREAILRG